MIRMSISQTYDIEHTFQINFFPQFDHKDMQLWLTLSKAFQKVEVPIMDTLLKVVNIL